MSTITKASPATIYAEAHRAGCAALEAIVPDPMIVSDQDGRAYYVGGGVCGFAWIRVPGNTAFARWCKSQRIGHKGYPSGWSVWVHQGGQSMQRKEAYAVAFAEVLKSHGIKASAESRMD